MSASLAAWLHDIDPYAFRIAGDFGIRWYGLSYVLGFVLGWLALRFLHARGMALIPRERLTDAIIFAALGAVVGGRLGYILFYEQSLLWTFSSSPPFWGVFMLGRGGMASHGGMLGVLIAGVVISRGYKSESGERIGKASPLHVFDLYALIAPFGLFLGRLANFVNGELLGKVVARPGEAGPWWSVRYPQEIYSGHDSGLRTEAQDAELRLLIDQQLPADASEFVKLESLIERVQSGSGEMASAIEPLLSARHPSQLYQALAEGVVLGLIIWIFARTPRKPGAITAIFLIAYGVMRIATEFVRLPDPGMSGLWGFSRGQVLSLIMILIGLALFVWSSGRNTARIGGWGSPRDLSASASSDR